MKPYTTEQGIVAPLDRSNVDTDLIIPKQFLKSIKRTGFGDNLFDELRYLDEGFLGQDIAKRPKNPDFVLNQARYAGATILLAAPSFADIFYNNCFKNGMLPVILSEKDVDELFKECFANIGYQLTVDLENQKVISPSGKEYSFEVDAFRKHCLLNGLDDIGLTLQHADEIKAFEEKAKADRPWVFKELGDKQPITK